MFDKQTIRPEDSQWLVLDKLISTMPQMINLEAESILNYSRKLKFQKAFSLFSPVSHCTKFQIPDS